MARQLPSDRMKFKVGNYSAPVDTTNMEPEDKEIFKPVKQAEKPMSDIETKIAIRNKQVKMARIKKAKKGY